MPLLYGGYVNTHLRSVNVPDLRTLGRNQLFVDAFNQKLLKPTLHLTTLLPFMINHFKENRTRLV